MTSAFVSFINRRDYDSSSSSSSSSFASSQKKSFASFQKKNYSEHTNEYITLLIKKWKFLNLQDTNLWVTFRDDFEEWTEQSFKTTTNDVLRSLRNFLRKHDVWISRQKRKTIARSLQEVLEKETETTWIEKKISNSLDEKFESSKITCLIATDFERNSRDYSWQASSRSESRRELFRSRDISRSRKSSFRDRSERSLQQSAMRHLFRESSIARTFLRQSSSSQSENQEISSSEISEISQNFYNRHSHSHLSENPYSDSSSQTENFYIRQSDKTSMLRQSFQTRFPKFYPSSELSEHFYKRSIEYSSSISSRSFVSSWSLVSSSSLVSSRFYFMNIRHRFHLDHLSLIHHFHQWISQSNHQSMIENWFIWQNCIQMRRNTVKKMIISHSNLSCLMTCVIESMFHLRLS